MFHVPVERRDHARQPNDLRAGAQNGRDLHRTSTALDGFGSKSTARKTVSGRLASNTSLDQKRVTISPVPILVIECVYPGGISTTLKASPSTRYSETGPPSMDRMR